jgi:hypothetical protein
MPSVRVDARQIEPFLPVLDVNGSPEQTTREAMSRLDYALAGRGRIRRTKGAGAFRRQAEAAPARHRPGARSGHRVRCFLNLPRTVPRSKS